MERLIEQKLPEIKRIFEKYHSKTAFLFGSATKNSLTNKSDIDFLFSFDKDLDYEIYAENYYALLHDLEQLV